MQKTKTTMITDMTRGPLAKQILYFSAPLMLANVLQTLYNMVDLAIVGQVVGSEGVSAVAVAGQITFLLYTLGMGFGNAGQILISQQVGAGNRDGIRRTIGTTLTFHMILSVVVVVLGLTFSTPLLRMLNTPPEAWQDATDYLFWCCLGIPFIYGYGGLCAILRGMGDSKRPMYFISIASISNVILDILLVAVFGMRAKGAAIATAASQFLSCLFAFIYLYKNQKSFGFEFKRENLRIDKNILRITVNLATPLVFMQMAITVSMMFVNAWVNAYGVIASAVGGIGTKLYSVASIITNSMQTAEATFAGQNIAAGRHDRLRRSMFVTTMYGLAYWFVLAALLLLFPKGVFSIFTSEPEVLAMAPRFMVIQTVLYLSFALMTPPIGFITGIGNTRLNFLIAVADGVIARIGLGLFLAITCGIGLYGYWWGSALAGFVSVIPGWIYYFSGKWKSRKILG